MRCLVRLMKRGYACVKKGLKVEFLTQFESNLALSLPALLFSDVEPSREGG